MKPKKQIQSEMYGPDEEAAAANEAAAAIDFIESHLFDELTVPLIAAACTTSEFHFSRRFSRRQGESVMAYVRGRRLDIAATRLASEPDVAIQDVAFECRFESQAAFTRAFSRAFGIAPMKFRVARLPLVRKRKGRMNQALKLEESIEDVEAFSIAGLAGTFDPSNFLQISELWKRFATHSGFQGRLGEGETCGVFRNRDFAAYGFEHLAGARVATGSQPTGLQVWTLPGRQYLVYKQALAEGELHPQVAAAQQEIWGKRLAQSGRTLANAPDFQIYPANFKVGEGGWLAYYIPIE